MAIFGLTDNCKVVEWMLDCMEVGFIDFQQLLIFKMSQDNLDFFSSVRLRNGWCLNPSLVQFQTAFRELLGNCSVHIKGSEYANFVRENHTEILNILFGTNDEEKAENGLVTLILCCLHLQSTITLQDAAAASKF